jgi:G3E family GTPase
MSSIPIYLIVGFLGSGKTTLLKRLVNATEGLHYLYVINEFSAVDVDAGQIEKEGGVAIAVAGGSIFCRCLISEFVSEMVDSVTDRVRSINNNARVMHCTHCDVDPDLILKGGGSESLNLLDADYNKCKDPHYEREALAFKGKVALSDLVALFNGPLDGLYRVKGYVECNEGWYFVEWSEGGLSHQAALPQPTSTLTVIWNPAIDSLVVGQLRYLAF